MLTQGLAAGSEAHFVAGGRQHLLRTLLNLCSNAIQYSGGSPDAATRVRICVSNVDAGNPSQTTFRFEVADEGRGMSKEEQVCV